MKWTNPLAFDPIISLPHMVPAWPSNTNLTPTHFIQFLIRFWYYGIWFHLFLPLFQRTFSFGIVVFQHTQCHQYLFTMQTFLPSQHFWKSMTLLTRMVRSTSWVYLLEYSVAQAKPGILLFFFLYQAIRHEGVLVATVMGLRAEPKHDCDLQRWW